MDTHPSMPKAVWGFNGTERPGAVYLAAALAGYSQKGLPAFGIYGRDVQDAGDTSIPADVQEKIIRFAKAALASAQMKGKSYLSIGYSSMGIAGSMVDPDFFQNTWASVQNLLSLLNLSAAWNRASTIRMNSLKQWPGPKPIARRHDLNSAELQSDRKRKDWEWETVVKMTLIARDLMGWKSEVERNGIWRRIERP